MSSRICDRDPCELLHRIIRHLRPQHSSTEHVDVDVVIQSMDAKKAMKSMVTRLSMRYCPSCGTRIDPSYLEGQEVQQRRAR